MIPEDYVPFGEEWKKEISKHRIDQLELIFSVKINPGERKEDFVNRISELKKAAK